MSWAGKSTNDWLTKQDITDAISAVPLYAHGSAPAGKASADWVTKAEVRTWVQMSSALPNNADWITKGGVTSNGIYAPYAHTVYYECAKVITSGWITRANACASWGTCSNTLYSSSATLAAGSTLYLLSGGVYQPYIPSALYGAGLWFYESGLGPFQMTNTSNNVILALDTCTPTYYYYDAEYWTDCSGVTTYGEIVRSTVPLTLQWTRVGPTAPGANYLRITGTSGSTAYTYESDDTENASCGY